MGQSLLNCDVRITSAYPSISDLILQMAMFEMCQKQTFRVTAYPRAVRAATR
jgi:hypothetical protein